MDLRNQNKCWRCEVKLEDILFSEYEYKCPDCYKTYHSCVDCDSLEKTAPLGEKENNGNPVSVDNDTYFNGNYCKKCDTHYCEIHDPDPDFDGLESCKECS